MKKSISFAFYLSNIFLLFGQLCTQSQNFQVGYAPMIPAPGYIITKAGDTIMGKITYGKFIENFMSEIKFTGPDGIKSRFTADDLHGMGICLTAGMTERPHSGAIYWDNYECRPSPRKGIMIFMNKFTDGRIKVFMNRSSASVTVSTTKFVRTPFEFKFTGINFEFSPQGGLIIGPEFNISFGYFESRSWYSSYYVEKEGTDMIKVEKENYRDLWENLYGDCQMISEELSKNPDLAKYSNFLIVVEIYNQICSRSTIK